MRMVRWCIRLTRLTLVCEVIRYRLVQVRQNQKKKKTFRVGGPRSPFSISSSFILSFVLLPFFLNTKVNSWYLPRNTLSVYYSVVPTPIPLIVMRLWLTNFVEKGWQIFFSQKDLWKTTKTFLYLDPVHKSGCSSTVRFLVHSLTSSTSDNSLSRMFAAHTVGLACPHILVKKLVDMNCP